MALYLVGGYLTTLGSGTGWVGYAPLSNVPLEAIGGMRHWIRLLIWLALVVVWVAFSLVMLHVSTDRGDNDRVDHDAADRRES